MQLHWYYFQLDLPPANVRVKELETIMNELQSELEVKSKAVEILRNENKAIMDRYVKLKRKYDLTEDDSAVLSQSVVLDPLEYDSEVSIITIDKY